MIETLRDVITRVAAARDRNTALRLAAEGVKSALLADACAVYLIDSDTDELVLAETNGLDQGSIGQVRLPKGMGVISLVREQRETVRCENVSLHPRFHSVPVTGEKRFRAFLGAPMVHRGQVVGVLAIWRTGRGQFDERDEAFLVTAAAQLSGSLASEVLTSFTNPEAVRAKSPSAAFHQGVPGAPGVAIGYVVLPSPFADLETVPDREAEDVVLEEAAFLDAVAAVQQEILASGERMKGMLPSEAHALFEVYAMLAGDQSLVSQVVQRIRGGAWAPGALRDTIAEFRAELDAVSDERLKVRSEDIRAVGRRLLLALHSDQLSPKAFPEQTVLVGDDVSLARIADVPRERLAGIVCLRGSVLSHTVVVARALGIPAIMGLEDLSPERLDGKLIVLDGYLGRVFIDPAPIIIDEYRRLEHEERVLTKELASLSDQPAETPDGKRITLQTNTGMLSDIDLSLTVGSEGVGLYRSEFPFMLRESFPSEAEQYESYRQMLMAFSPRPVVMRTLDIGGDKQLPYFPIDQTNSLLGWRGIRVTLQHPELFLVQLKAMLRANAGLGNLRLLLPMVSNVGEVRDAKALIRQAHAALRQRGETCALPPLGTMVEVPVLLFCLESLAKEVDFISIGSNDLTQYLTATDRGNPRVAHLYDDLSPGVLRALRLVVDEARRLGIATSLCGELAADPAGAVLLVGMGIEHLSMTPSALPRVKKALCAISFDRSAALLEQALALASGEEVRAMIHQVFRADGLGGLVQAGQ